jgi:hypothetical protein
MIGPAIAVGFSAIESLDLGCGGVGQSRRRFHVLDEAA